MRDNQFNRLLKLIQRTGDRLVVLDQESESAVVMMDIDVYEKYLNGQENVATMSETDILDRINREIAVWREKNLANSVEDVDLNDDLVIHRSIVDNNTSLPSMSNSDVTVQGEQKKPIFSGKKNSPNISDSVEDNIVEGKEETLHDVPDDGEEEKFYLEPV